VLIDRRRGNAFCAGGGRHERLGGQKDSIGGNYNPTTPARTLSFLMSIMSRIKHIPRTRNSTHLWVMKINSLETEHRGKLSPNRKKAMSLPMLPVDMQDSICQNAEAAIGDFLIIVPERFCDNHLEAACHASWHSVLGSISCFSVILPWNVFWLCVTLSQLAGMYSVIGRFTCVCMSLQECSNPPLSETNL
jgi:hypothetical protein